MAQNADEKRKSNVNTNANFVEARVIANYGDPGLDENYHFDILSRFIIVMIESSYRVPTVDKWANMFAMVMRPKHLWINAEEGRSESPNSQKRSDQLGNLSVGLASDNSISGIGRINYPYQLGELIKIKKLPQALKVGIDQEFISAFNDSDQNSYGDWHTQGSTLSYFSGKQNRINGLKLKAVDQLDNSNLYKYAGMLFKYQYEAFMLNLALSDSGLSQILPNIFGNILSKSNGVYLANGGYIFQNFDRVQLLAAEYVDVNIGDKQRTIGTDGCLPLIVATPNNFPTPKVRAVGTISYNPTYATIVKSN